MAVYLETKCKRFLADSAADILPRAGVMFDGVVLAATDIPVGSTVLYRDSGKVKRWNGSDWADAAPPETEEALLPAILVELRSINERLNLATA